MRLTPGFPNSATVRVPERLVLRGGRWKPVRLAVRYGVFRHPQAGTCLIDTGYTEYVTRGKRSLPLAAYAAILRPRLGPERLTVSGVQPDCILLTHLHADHVSALRDYPEAKVFAHAGALGHYLSLGAMQRTRHGVFTELLPEDLTERVIDIEGMPTIEGPLGLGPCHDLFGDGSVLAVPLPGHMRGHTGFVFPGEAPPLLYAGDATFLHKAMMEERMPGPPARWILDSRDEAGTSAQRIAAFVRAGGRVVHCHDPEPLS